MAISNDKLPGEYIAGFVDGEGCFSLNFRRDVRHERKNHPTYFAWQAQFIVNIRADDARILEAIKNTLGCGILSLAKKGMISFAVQNINELHDIIIPFFRKFSLFGKKKYDFNLWAEAVEIIYQHKKATVNLQPGKKGFVKNDWSKENFNRLLDIVKTMRPYKSGVSKEPKWLYIAETMLEEIVP